MKTTIENGDLVWIVPDAHGAPDQLSVRGVVMSTIDENWFRVYSSYWTSVGEKTSIQDFPSHMLKKIVYEDNNLCEK